MHGQSRFVAAAALFVAAAAFSGCVSNDEKGGVSGSHSTQKSGFVVIEKDGRLFVFEEGSRALTDFNAHGEMAKSVTRIGAGPNRETLIAEDGSVLDRYMAGR